MQTRALWRIAASVILVVVGGGLTGCDYWPPALQTQIEQLKTELQTVTAERDQLQSQLSAATKAREELQARVDELTRVNREKTAVIATLEHSLAAERQKLAKLTKTGKVNVAAKTAAKPTRKTASAKKKTARVSGDKRN